MKEGVVARRYAQALANLTPEEGQIESALSELEAVKKVLTENPNLKFTVQNPAVPVAVKEGIISDVLDGMKVSGFIRELMILAVKNHRVRNLGLIVDSYRDITDAQLNRIRVYVRTAFPLEPPEEKKLQETFGRITGRKAIISPQVDKSLIGGIVARIGWTVYDGSVLNELRNLRTKFETWLEEDI